MEVNATAFEETTKNTEDVQVPKENPYLSEETKKSIEELSITTVEIDPLPEVVETTTEEKLQSTRIELSFMKSQQEIERQKQISQSIQRGFPQFVNNLASKYKIDMNKYSYDAVEANFKRKK